MISQGLVLGSQGMLGNDIMRQFSRSGLKVLAPSHTELDITKYGTLRDFFEIHRPSWVINCVAKHDLQSCEIDFDNAMRINSEAVENLSELCLTFDAYFIHISTDYVFNGLKGSQYNELDITDPVNNYGYSKRAGEILALNRNPKACVVRVAALFGAALSRDKGNFCFVDRMKSKLLAGEEFEVNCDQIISPTSTFEVAWQLEKLIDFQPAGIVHCAGNGFTTWYNLTLEIAKNISVSASKVKMVESLQVPKDGINRPLNSSLENKRLSEFDLNLMRDWEIALRFYLKKDPLLNN
jgi:dTDP-4-dehydrorhamnose reductase